MSGLAHALLALVIIVIGCAVMIGKISLSEALAKIIGAAGVLLISAALLANAGEAWASLSAGARLAVVAAILLAAPLASALVILRSDFGKKVLASILGDWIYDRVQEGPGCCGVQVVLLLLLVVMLALILG
jgi:hypothetical protein